MSSKEINATDCSDEDIITFIENVRGGDAKHYQANWIIIRALKIIFKRLQAVDNELETLSME